MEQTMERNRVLLRGCLGELPAFSHENHGRQFWRMELAVERLSGAVDRLPVVAEATLFSGLELGVGDMVEVGGQMRSYNSRTQEGRHLIISVYAQNLQRSDGPPENQVYLQGRLCRDPVYRRTPLGREIADVMLAVERKYGRRDYLPCILWGALARMGSECRKGEGLWLEGRLQSRAYIKQLEGGSEARTAYEVSAVRADRMD